MEENASVEPNLLENKSETKNVLINVSPTLMRSVDLSTASLFTVPFTIKFVKMEKPITKKELPLTMIPNKKTPKSVSISIIMLGVMLIMLNITNTRLRP